MIPPWHNCPLDQVINLAKRRGSSSRPVIYGGSRSAGLWTARRRTKEISNLSGGTPSSGTWRYGRCGFFHFLPRQVWEASGHVETFVDPLSECTACNHRHRYDHLVEAFEDKHGRTPALEELACPNCGTRGKMTEPRTFSGLIRTFLGPVADDEGLHYLRPETAQGMYLNFLNVVNTARKKPPFGMGQIGKAFRNEITPGNFIFRTREFEQMEIQYFVPPAEVDHWFDIWVNQAQDWFFGLGLKPENLRQYNVPDGERAHYSTVTIDLEYKFGFTGGDWGN